MQPYFLSLLALFLRSVTASELWARDKGALCSIVHYCPEAPGRWVPGFVPEPFTTFKTARYSLSCTDYTVCDRTTSTSSNLPTTICSESTTSSSCSETTTTSSTCTETTPSSTCTESSSITTSCSETPSSPLTTWTTRSHTHYHNTTSHCPETSTYSPLIPTPPPLTASSDTCKTTTTSVPKYTTSQPYVLSQHV